MANTTRDSSVLDERCLAQSRTRAAETPDGQATTGELRHCRTRRGCASTASIESVEMFDESLRPLELRAMARVVERDALCVVKVLQHGATVGYQVRGILGTQMTRAGWATWEKTGSSAAKYAWTSEASAHPEPASRAATLHAENAATSAPSPSARANQRRAIQEAVDARKRERAIRHTRGAQHLLDGGSLLQQREPKGGGGDREAHACQLDAEHPVASFQ